MENPQIEIVKWQVYGVLLFACFIGALGLMCWRMNQMAEYVVAAAV